LDGSTVPKRRQPNGRKRGSKEEKGGHQGKGNTIPPKYLASKVNEQLQRKALTPKRTNAKKRRKEKGGGRIKNTDSLKRP